jgi:inosine-uridine nucleoside N-ribohydrolase
MTKPVIIDCDPGHDDAIALFLALASEELDVLGVTTVAGNSTLENTTRNALSVMELTGRRDVPIAVGAAAPLKRPLVVAESVHGTSGLDGPELPTTAIQPIDGHAIDLMAEAISSSSDPVTLIPTGPLTNIAMLMESNPGVLENVSEIVFMGGAVELGNVTPNAEFNIYVDPEAAEIVLSSGLPITMIGLEVTHQALFGSQEAELLRGRNSVCTFVAELLDFFVANHPRTYSSPGAPVHDVVAVAHVIDPTLVTTERCGVRIDTTDGLGRGRTVVDRWHVTDWQATVNVGFGLDCDAFSDLLFERLALFD